MNVDRNPDMLPPASGRVRSPATVASLLLLLLPAVSAGCLQGSDTQAPGKLEAQMAWEISPGEFAEVNIEMLAEQRFSGHFQATAPMAWDLHTHGEDGVEVLDQGRDRERNLTFQAPHDGTFSLYLENPGSNATTVAVVLDGQGRVVSSVPS